MVVFPAPLGPATTNKRGRETGAAVIQTCRSAALAYWPDRRRTLPLTEPRPKRRPSRAAEPQGLSLPALRAGALPVCRPKVGLLVIDELGSTIATPISSFRSSAVATRKKASCSPPISPSPIGAQSFPMPPVRPRSLSASCIMPISSRWRATATGFASLSSRPPPATTHDATRRPRPRAQRPHSA